MSTSKWLPEVRALDQVFSVRSYLVTYPFMALGVGVLYALLLPGLPLGTLAPWVLQFLKPTQLAFAIIMGLLLPLVVLFNVFLWRNPCCSVSTKRRSNGGLMSLVLGLVPNALCCTPIVPAVVALFASGASLIAISAPVQYFFNVYAWILYALAGFGVWVSLRVVAARFNPARMSSDKTEPLDGPPSPMATALYFVSPVRSSRDCTGSAMDGHTHKNSVNGSAFGMNIGGGSETRWPYGIFTETMRESWCNSTSRHFGIDCPSKELRSGL